MFRTIVTSVSLALGLAASIGCATDEGGRGGGPGSACAGAKCDEVDDVGDDAEITDHPEYREAIDACEAAADRLMSRTNAKRYDSVVDIERARAACLEDANDEILSVVDDVASARDEETDALADHVGRYRDARGDLCGMLVDAGEGGVTKEGPVDLQTCAAQSELDLADLIGAYAALGVDAVEIPQSRVRYPECWSAYDDADPQLASQTREATEELIECIGLANDEARDELVTMIQSKFPGRTEDTLLDDTRRAMRSHANAVTDVCEILATAGPTVASTEVEQAQLDCQVAGLSMVGNLGELLVAGVWPEDAEGESGSDTGE